MQQAAGNRGNKTRFFLLFFLAQIMNKGGPVGACWVYANPEANFHPVLRAGPVPALFVVDPRSRPCSNSLQQEDSGELQPHQPQICPLT